MSEWYYARSGVQSGPVSFEQLREIASSGGLHPTNDLVWNSTMKDWTPAGQVAGIFAAPPQASAPAPDPLNPYSAPQSAWVEPVVQYSGEVLVEIVPGSEPIDAMACVKRGFDLTLRHASTIAIVFLIFFGVNFGLNMVTSLIQGLTNAFSHSGGFESHSFGDTSHGGFSSHSYSSVSSEFSPVIFIVVSAVTLIRMVANVYLGMGVMRVCLNLVSGKPATVSMLFGESNKLLRAIGASLLFAMMVSLGFLLFIVPGIYLLIRYGEYMRAIVDRDMGVMDSFSYSSTLTTNNRMNLFVLGLLTFLIMIAGFLACCVGALVATPVVSMISAVAYRWMQYGHRAAMDYPGTQTPMLSGVQ